jgi:hypothetical protein
VSDKEQRHRVETRNIKLSKATDADAASDHKTAALYRQGAAMFPGGLGVAANNKANVEKAGHGRS